MKSLFDPQQSEAFIERIKRLAPMSEAKWGGMSVSQMMAHLQVPLNLALDYIEIKPNKWITFLFGKRAKRNMVADERPFEKNIPTFKQARIKEARQFEPEREKLIALIKAFQAGGPNSITKKPHPFFGEMTPQDWDILQTKHIDHHLRQFGV